MTDLPSNWTITKLKTVANLVTGNTPSTKSPEFYGGSIPFAKPGDLDAVVPITKTEQCLSALGAQQSRLVRPGSTLVSCIGNLGKVGFAGVSLATNQQINSAEFHSSVLDDRYGYYLCKTLKPWMERESSATTIAILNKGKFGEAPVPLAPLAEQKRIAGKLDTVLARVDAVNERLTRVAPLLKRFRQSVLAAATSGRLTEDWRVEHQQTLPFHSMSLSQVCEKITDGEHISPTKTPFGIPLLTAKNVTDSGLTFNDTHFVSEHDAEKFWLRCRPEMGDTLICSRGTIGRSTLIDLDRSFCLMGTVILLKPKKAIFIPKFLSLVIAAPGTQEAMRGASGATAVSALYLKDIKHLEIKVPGLEEQSEIVRRVETLFAFADRLEARLQTTRIAANRLTPALLAKAFRGELVAQDPNDEPAAELLKRLAVNAPASPKRRGRPAKAG